MNGECVELARMAGGVAVRDSKALPGPMLRFRPDAWRTFLTEVRDGRFDVA